MKNPKETQKKEAAHTPKPGQTPPKPGQTPPKPGQQTRPETPRR